MATLHIEVKNLSKSFEQQGKEILAIDNISLNIESQDIYGVIGPSGSGKSTLVRLLARLLNPTSGQIFFQGGEIGFIEGQSLLDFYKSIGMVFQNFNLFNSRTVAENVSFPLEIARWTKESQKARVDEILGFVGLAEKKDAYPAMLSGGEKQRVGIARALANKSQTLFCDEPTSALDPTTASEILNLLKSVNKHLGVTIVLITHDMDAIKAICNKVAVMDSGKIIEEGLVMNVFEEPKEQIT
jgi:D-methionine transport system ATP-binding protein